MVNKKNWLGMLVLILVFGMTIVSCSTTHSITYTSSEQPSGDYKFAEFSAYEFSSVLQRFYARYPSSQYEVVAYEKIRKNWMPLVIGLGTGVLGLTVGTIAFIDADPWVAATLIPTMTFSLGGIGASVGNLFKDRYIVTYVERQAPIQSNEE